MLSSRVQCPGYWWCYDHYDAFRVTHPVLSLQQLRGVWELLFSMLTKYCHVLITWIYVTQRPGASQKRRIQLHDKKSNAEYKLSSGLITPHWWMYEFLRQNCPSVDAGATAFFNLSAKEKVKSCRWNLQLLQALSFPNFKGSRLVFSPQKQSGLGWTLNPVPLH